MNNPLWLGHPGMQQLLHALVDRLDAEEVSGKPAGHSFKLNAKTWPALYRAEFEAEKEVLWSYLESLEKQDWFALKLNRPQLGQAAYERNPRLSDLNAQVLRKATGRPERVRTASEQWRLAITKGLVASDEVKESVLRYRIDIPGKSADDIVVQLNMLSALEGEPLLLREVSARLFWGQSKVLDKKQDLIAKLVGLEECPFPLMPVQLHVFLPVGDYQGALFIENLTTFEQATRGSSDLFKNLALIYAAGFKGSAKRLRTRSGSSLYFASHGDLDAKATGRFIDWLYLNVSMPSWFWGDLDFSGMQILRTLKNSFSDLMAWQPGYAPMLDLLLRGGGHFPDAAGKAAQTKVEHTGCAYADKVLLPHLLHTGKFVDQEMT